MDRESIYNKMTPAEKEVALVLKELGIKWVYEKPVFVWDKGNRPRVWAPDFFLTQFSIYVEVCGSEDFDYEYRKKIFDRNGIRVIFLHLYKDKRKWKYHFMCYLERFIEDRCHKLNEVFKKENYINFITLLQNR